MDKTVLLIVAVFLAGTQLTRVDAFCFSYQWECDNGQCIDEDYLCDGDYDCSDRSDEQNCFICIGYECDDGTCTLFSSDRCDSVEDCDDGSDEDGCVNLGLAIGLSIFFFILFCVCCPVVIIVVIWCCVAGALGQSFRNRPVHQTVATAPAGGTTVVATTNTSTATTAGQKTADNPPPYPGGYPMTQFPQQPAYPAQQPAYPPQQQPAAYPPQQPAYTGQQPVYPAQQPAYPAQQPAYPGQQPAYPPQQPAYPVEQPLSHAPGQTAYPYPDEQKVAP